MARKAKSKDPVCYVCGEAASVRILVAGEDEKLREKLACASYARGHRKVEDKVRPRRMTA